MITVLRQIIFDEFMTYIERLELGNFLYIKFRINDLESAIHYE